MSTSIGIATSQPRAWLRQTLGAYPVASFFALAFAGSWLIELPVVLGQSGIGLLPFNLPFMPFFVLMPFSGPLLAALLVTAAEGGRPAVGQLVRGWLQWRRSAGWYLFALFGPPILYLAGAAAVSGSAPLATLAAQWPRVFTDYLLPLPLTLVLGGALGEEPGWRGFALPRLQRRYGALPGTLILGALHAAWHLPLFLVEGTYAPLTLASFLFFAGVLILNAITWTWVFNHTRPSLLIMMLLHAAVNAGGGLVGPLVPATPYLDWIPIIGFGSLALALVLATRGRLGYRPGSS